MIGDVWTWRREWSAWKRRELTVTDRRRSRVRSTWAPALRRRRRSTFAHSGPSHATQRQRRVACARRHLAPNGPLLRSRPARRIFQRAGGRSPQVLGVGTWPRTNRLGTRRRSSQPRIAIRSIATTRHRAAAAVFPSPNRPCASEGRSALRHYRDRPRTFVLRNMSGQTTVARARLRMLHICLTS